MKKLFYFINAKLLFMLMLITVLLAACSEQDSKSNGDNGLNVSSYYPLDISPTALHERITVQFNRVSGIGAENSDACLPYYDVKIGLGDDINTAYDLGTVEPNDSLLIRFAVKKTESASDSTEGFPFFYYTELSDNTEYTIWIRSNFSKCGYGQSNWTYVKATPIPYPSQLENVKVEQGDNHLRLSWDKKAGEIYSVHVDDCPSKEGQYSKWTPALSINNNHYIIELANNSELYDGSDHSICIVSYNANGFLDADNKSTWKVFGKDIFTTVEEKSLLQGKPATAAPEKPVIENMQGKNKRAEFSFKTAPAGSAAVSVYQAGYSTDNANYTWLETAVPFNYDTANTVVSSLENGKLYYIKLRAKNSFSENFVESEPVTVTPEYTPVDLNDLNQYLGTAAGDFIYAEDVPHSDFWRISTNFNAGGRPNTDRLVRGKETALGNLFADAVKWYGSEMTNTNPDFAWLIGDMINQGIQSSQVITTAFLQTIITSDYLDDTLVTVTLNGSDLIINDDYTLNLDLYPAVGDSSNPYTKTLFGQAASVYRNNHYGGSGGTTYNGKWWGIPSSEVRYTIEYMAYSIDEFNERFNTNCSTINKSTGIDSDTGALYDAVNDPKKCYLLTYEAANPESGDPTETSVMGYKRGRIMQGSLFINNQAVYESKQYVVITTTKTAKEMYVAFLGKQLTPVLDMNNQPVTLLKAVAEYVAYKNSISPYLDGRIKLSGGVPGNTANDFNAGN
ncbi:MAG TPA: 5'-nucleotidase C-terminal domain-containing protein [Candidatus Mucispirillum faecigallinarum]|uniref:5'-nucleotidase C-terminal domain-containing protein n=1 Tax=Candidatus Mucispirillum faecigallinarum TaxID=2838699 RepID=A0A9D2GVV1_9BACT|nr:5'-nucleotidase C-terminal domain-containing protein [Candidatus Mucispirillum faecigallinarum]